MLETSCQIFDSVNERTLVFNNLYFINGEFFFNNSKANSDLAAYPNVHYRQTNHEKWSPIMTRLLDEEISIIKQPHFYFKETLHYHPGHTLMDDVFSIFYSLNKCGINYNPFICIIETDHKENPYDCKGIFKLLFGQEAVPFWHIKNTYPKICFETFVVGTGDCGLSSYDDNYVSTFKDNIWKQFRDAFYEKSNIKLESGNKIIYVNIKMEEDYLPINFRKILKENNIQIVTWGGIDFIEQLNILKDVKIYITTDGSVALNCVFLQNGAVVINLGRVYEIDDYQAIGYSDDYLYPSLPYIDVLYFEDYYELPIKDSYPTPNTDDLLDIVKAITEKIKDHRVFKNRAEIYEKFASKVIDTINWEIKLDNFSPNARLLFENFKERSEIIKEFKRDNLAFACNEKVRSLKNK